MEIGGKLGVRPVCWHLVPQAVQTGRSGRGRSRAVERHGRRQELRRGPVLAAQVVGGNDGFGMGEPLRRLRPVLPQQARGGGDRTAPIYTDVGCRLLDGKTCRCRDYAHRLEKVEDCVQLTPESLKTITWLPPILRLRAAWRRARTFIGGIRWSPATPTQCMRPASRCAAVSARARRTYPTTCSRTTS